jgi:endonuclease/exonuclease/phosphatase family metal-dependent hydrolase
MFTPPQPPFDQDSTQDAPPPPPQVRRPGSRPWGGWLALLLLAAGLATWVLNVSRPGTRVEGCAEGCSTAGLGDERSLRVLSLNVLHGFPRFVGLAPRLDRIAAEIRSQGVDVACLQEVPWTRQLGSGAGYLARETGLNHVYVRANGNRHAILFEEGLAILSRFPLQEPAYFQLEPRAGFFEQRIVLKAAVSAPWGDVDLFVTHLTHGEPEINAQQVTALRHVVTSAGENPAIVAGDFNAGEDSAQIQELAREWVDLFRAANPGEAGLTCCAGNVTRGPEEPLEKRIDYIFWVPRGSGVPQVEARVVLDEAFPWAGGWLWPSDHAGVLVDLYDGR